MHPPPMQCGSARYVVKGRSKVAASTTCHTLWWIEAIVSPIFIVRFGKVNGNHEMGGGENQGTRLTSIALRSLIMAIAMGAS